MDKCDTKIDLIEYVSQWPIFYGPVIFSCIFQITLDRPNSDQTQIRLTLILFSNFQEK